jgi:hypothetical protein
MGVTNEAGNEFCTRPRHREKSRGVPARIRERRRKSRRRDERVKTPEQVVTECVEAFNRRDAAAAAALYHDGATNIKLALDEPTWGRQATTLLLGVKEVRREVRGRESLR